MKKRAYRALPVETVNCEELQQAVRGQHVVVGLDVAKTKFFAAITLSGARVVATVKWLHPAQTNSMVALLVQLGAAKLEVALEPSGSYGDPVMGALRKAGIPVYRVSPKRVFDAAEVYDGVPSQHDAKCAAIIAKLHWDGASRPWEQRTDEQRELDAAIEELELFGDEYRRRLNQLEGKLAIYWPEISQCLQLDSRTLWALLNEFGSAQEIARREDETRSLMTKTGGNLMPEKKIACVIEAAKSTLGLEPLDGERKTLRLLVAELGRCHDMHREGRRRVEALSSHLEATKLLCPIVGKVTAAVLVSKVGCPTMFAAAAMWLKAMGMNLKERSSGKHQGQLGITKRGSGAARKYLCFAAFRLIQRDPVMKAWYEHKVNRYGGRGRMRAVVAVMRKLAKALWHVARGSAFDTTKLVDVRRLGLESVTQN